MKSVFRVAAGEKQDFSANGVHGVGDANVVKESGVNNSNVSGHDQRRKWVLWAMRLLAF